MQRREFIRDAVLSGMLLLTPLTANADDAVQPVAAAAEEARKHALFDHVVLIGASVSAGFTQSELLGGPETAGYRLKHYFDSAILDEHLPTEAFGGSLFFINPEKTADVCIRKAQAARPSLVVAIDFLFWFCYGKNMTSEERLEMFEKGLGRLEKMEGPLVVGDVPNAAAAVDKILSSEQLPPVDVIERCNARLSEWASERGQVSIISLAAFLEAAMADQPLSVRSQKWTEGATRALLQADCLHPSHHGCVGLTFLALDAALRITPSVSPECVCWNLEQVYAEGLEASKPPPSPDSAATPNGASRVE